MLTKDVADIASSRKLTTVRIIIVRKKITTLLRYRFNRSTFDTGKRDCPERVIRRLIRPRTGVENYDAARTVYRQKNYETGRHKLDARTVRRIRFQVDTCTNATYKLAYSRSRSEKIMIYENYSRVSKIIESSVLEL